MWIAETPWPVIVACAAVAALLYTGWHARGHVGYLIGAGLCLVLAGGTYVAERYLVTESERVELALDDLWIAVKSRDVDTVVDKISTSAKDLREQAARAVQRFEVSDELDLTQVRIEMKAQNSRALTSFRANGPIRDTYGGGSYHGVTRWELTWQREGDQWRIIRITRLDPFTGEEVSRFSP